MNRMVSFHSVAVFGVMLQFQMFWLDGVRFWGKGDGAEMAIGKGDVGTQWCQILRFGPDDGVLIDKICICM